MAFKVRELSCLEALGNRGGASPAGSLQHHFVKISITIKRKQSTLQATLFLAMGLKSIFKIMALNSSAIIINMLAPKAQLGAVSGASMTLQVLSPRP